MKALLTFDFVVHIELISNTSRNGNNGGDVDGDGDGDNGPSALTEMEMMCAASRRKR